MTNPTTVVTDRRLLAGMILLALAYQWLQNGQMLIPVLRDGAWFDTDDAMRMVGVRAWLDGQGWFDLTAHRMGASEPMLMHWSRVVDVPLAILIRGFDLVAAPALAETLTRIVFPAALFALLIVGILRAAEAVAGPAARVPAIVLTALGGPAADQFVPGRIDHHAPQIVLLAFIIAGLLGCFEKGREKRAATVGALAALSLSISIENVPFLLVVVASLGVNWVVRGEEARTQLRSFALGLGLSAALLFLLTVPPALHTAEVCDAFGAPYLLGTVTGALMLFAAVQIAPASIAGRLGAAALGSAITLLIMRVVYPNCLGDPFAGLHPLLREVWLQNVSEARPLAVTIRARPMLAGPLLVPPLLALASALWLARRTPDGPRRTQLLSLAALCAGGLLAAAWMVRSESSLGAPVMIAAAIFAAHIGQRATDARGSLLPILLPLVVCLPMSSAVWAALLPAPTGQAADPARPGPKPSCTAPKDFAGLAKLPPMRLLSSLDAGPYILVHTAHSVLAGPYHRNNEGNLASVQTFLASPTQAREFAHASHATHLAFCAQLAEVAVLADREPAGLAARLLAGEVPEWLTPVPVSGPWRLFQID